MESFDFLYKKAIKSVDIPFIEDVIIRLMPEGNTAKQIMRLQERVNALTNMNSSNTGDRMNILCDRYDTFMENIGL